MTTRRRFIKALACLPPALSYRPVWAADPRTLVVGQGSAATSVASVAESRAGDPSRLALIIGNGAYSAAPLGNPVNDARAMSRLLGQAGFTVNSLLNATRVEMLAAIERFGNAAKKGEARQVLFYYAGHGAQLDWHNYLLPVDANVQKPEHLKDRCVDLNQLLGQFRGIKEKTFVVVLDACRDNPFGSAYKPEHKGLSQFDAPVGSLLAYATSPGNTASDGEGENGLYTGNLVRELSRRDTRLEDALKRVRLNVRLASQGAQVPWETTSLEGDVFLFSEGQKKLTEGELEQQLEADIAEWARIKSSKNLDDWTGYLRKFPNGRFAEIAQLRLARLLAEVEQRAAEERQRQEQQRLERERLRLAEERRQAEEKRLSEEKRAAEEQKLAAERRQRDEQALREARRRQDEKARLDAERRLEQEKLAADQKRRELEAQLEAQKREQERIEAERVALEKDRQEAERVRREREQAVAVTRPSAAAPAATGKPFIEINPGDPVPQLIPPSSNPYSAGRFPLGRVFTVGDTWTTRISDILTGIEETTRTARVTRVDYDEDRVEFSNGIVVGDLMGNLVRTPQATYDAPVQLIPAEIQVGRKWTAAFRITRGGNTSNAYFDVQITRREFVTVPAGRFDCFRIDCAGWNLTGGGRNEMTLWIVPGINPPIKREQINRNRMGRIMTSERQELVSLRQQVTGLKL